MIASPSELRAHMFQVATDLNIPLDADLSDVRAHSDGVLDVVACSDRIASSELERRMTTAALHGSLLDEFARFVPRDLVRVRVTVASVDAPPARRPTQRIRGMAAEVDSLARASLVSLAESAYACVVESYPWRDREEMIARIPACVATTVANLRRNIPDPLVTFRNADAVLPPLSALLAPIDAEVVRADVGAHLGGRMPDSLLELYEILYERAACGETMIPQCAALARALFVL